MSPLLRKKKPVRTRASKARRIVATRIDRRQPSKPTATKTVLLVDIGSGSVGASLVELAPEKRPVTLALKRVTLRLAPQRDATRLQALIEAAMRDALAGLRSPASGKPIRNVAVFLPAPWSSLALHAVRFAQDRSFLASPLLMDRMIAAHVKDEEQHHESGNSGDASAKVFERSVAGLRLNGYVSPSLSGGAEVFTIEMMLAASQAPEGFLSRLMMIASEYAPGAEVSAHSSILSAAHALSAVTPDPHSFLLCDGEGELAELLMVRESIPEAHATVPVGYATVLRTIGLHGGLTHEEIPSMLSLMRDARSPASAAAQEAAELAAEHCARALGAAEPLCLSYAPRLCYIIGEGPEAEWFATAIKRSPRLTMALPKDFEVKIVTSAWLDGRTDAAYRQSIGDPMLSLHALFAADRFGGKEVQYFYS